MLSLAGLFVQTKQHSSVHGLLHAASSMSAETTLALQTSRTAWWLHNHCASIGLL